MPGPALMGTVERTLATDLRDSLELSRAVETGTLHGRTARALSRVFREVITIELSEELHASASEALRRHPQIRAVQGHSVDWLRGQSGAPIPTLYFLDGHWSAGETAGEAEECPVLDELEAIGAGHPDDCIIIDDARLFVAPPPPPHRPEAWPTIDEVLGTLRALRPHHLLELLNDQVVAVPERAKPALDAYARRVAGNR